MEVHFLSYMYISQTCVIQTREVMALGLAKYLMLSSMLVNKDILTWLLIGWQLCCQTIRCQVEKSLLTNIDFNMKIS